MNVELNFIERAANTEEMLIKRQGIVKFDERLYITWNFSPLHLRSELHFKVRWEVQVPVDIQNKNTWVSLNVSQVIIKWWIRLASDLIK